MSEPTTNPQATAAQAPAATNEPPLTSHDYDGIREYDNPMPGWWVWIFWGTIVFSGFYFFLATVINGAFSPVAEYDKAVAMELKKGGVLKPDAETLVRLSHDEESVKSGAAIFQTNCVSCHGRDAAGLTAPNLTDDSYINIKNIADIASVVALGAKNGAMPSWKNRLSPNEVVLVASYVASLRGQNKPGRPPEGQPIPPWSAQASAGGTTPSASTND
jgi:cytochrome c oxidase cbb3-type subunit 3